MSLETLLEVAKYVTAVAIFFVWVVRYENIVKEFKEYNLPTWLRDLTGILKLSFAIMILSKNEEIIIIGASGICLLMLAAQFTHLKVNSKVFLRLPSLILLGITGILTLNYIS